jgi:hypothetical protein
VRLSNLHLALSARRRGSGPPGTYYDFTGATLPSPWDTLRRAGLGTRIDAAGAVGYGAHNLLPVSRSDAGWLAAGTTAPTVTSGQTQGGRGCTLISFPALATGGFGASRAQRTLNTQATVTAGLRYTWRAKVWLSRALSPGEALQCYMTGAFGLVTIPLTSSTPAGQWIDIADTAGLTVGVGGQIYPVIFAGSGLSSPVDVWTCDWQLNQDALQTYLDNTTTAPLYLPRPTHNPSTLAALGVLFEGQATQFLAQPQNLSVSPWSGNAAPTQSADFEGLPAWTLTKTTAGTFEERRSGTFTATATSYCYTIIAWAGSASRVDAVIYNDGAGNAGTGHVATVVSGPGSVAVSSGYVQITGLSSTVPTVVVVSFTSSAGTSRLSIYPGGTSATTLGATVRVQTRNIETGTVPTSYNPNPGTGTALRTGDFAGGGISGASLTALLTPTQPFTIVLPFRKSYSLASVETLLGLCAGASAGTTNQLGIATNGTQAQLVHSGGSGALTGTLVLDGSTVNKVAVSVDPTARGAELATTPYTGSSTGAWSFGADIRRNGTTTLPATLTSVAGMKAAGSYLVTFDVADFSGDGFTLALNGGSPGIGQVTGNGPKSYVINTSASGSPSIWFIPWAGTAGQVTITNLSVRRAGAMSISVNGSAPVETTGIAYTGSGTTHLIPGARDSSGGQAATGFTSPGIRVASGYITGSALQALSV